MLPPDEAAGDVLAPAELFLTAVPIDVCRRRPADAFVARNEVLYPSGFGVLEQWSDDATDPTGALVVKNAKSRRLCPSFSTALHPRVSKCFTSSCSSYPMLCDFGAVLIFGNVLNFPPAGLAVVPPTP